MDTPDTYDQTAINRWRLVLGSLSDQQLQFGGDRKQYTKFHEYGAAS